jgi:phosphoribosyl-ATP pyrophosphohydrolase/phosphoribosyl-AMP cyclohydrolase
MISVSEINFDKLDGLIPACIQNVETSEVLMIGFMNRVAVERSIELGKVTFWSRTRKSLWTKGSTSGHFLCIESMTLDCDQDSLLIEVTPVGPTCHSGSPSCFSRGKLRGLSWYGKLLERIESRIKSPRLDSYTSSLVLQGEKRMAQKVGEEGLEVALAAVSGSHEELISECADLFFHTAVLLKFKGISFAKISDVLKLRFERESDRGDSQIT